MSTNTLIALVDGSVYSESVCHHAAWIAKANGWKVKLYHVMGRRTGSEDRDLSGAIKLGARTRLLEKLADVDAERAKLAKEHGRAILEDAAALIRGHGDIEVETRLRQDDLVETVTAKGEAGELIVIGKRGEAAGQAREHLGSNLERIVRAAQRPILIANRAFQAVKTALVAFDGGTSSLKAVDHIAREPAFAGVQVSLVYAGRLGAEIQNGLERAQAQLEGAGLASELIMREGEPEQVLSDLTSDPDGKILVMGAYGHSRVRNLLIGSTTTAMIRSCRTPVLIMR